jgi:hypothetical protein
MKNKEQVAGYLDVVAANLKQLAQDARRQAAPGYVEGMLNQQKALLDEAIRYAREEA